MVFPNKVIPSHLSAFADASNASVPFPTPSSPIRVFLVDDHAVVLAGLVTLLAAAPGLKVVGHASDGGSAIQKITRLSPSRSADANAPAALATGATADVDVVITDIQMAQGSGARATAQIKRRWPHIKVLALSMYEDGTHFKNIIEAGASGYVLKRSPADTLIRAIHAVHRGEDYIDPAISHLLAEWFLQKTVNGVSGTSLSEREEEVLRLVAQGYSSREAAERLTLSIKTVEMYKSRACQKLNLDGRTRILRYAIEQGWLGDLNPAGAGSRDLSPSPKR